MQRVCEPWSIYRNSVLGRQSSRCRGLEAELTWGVEGMAKKWMQLEGQEQEVSSDMWWGLGGVGDRLSKAV